MSAPPVSKTAPAASVTFTKPVVGGIQHNMPFTGGTRDPLQAQSSPKSPFAYRDFDTFQKVWKILTKGIDEEFKLKKSADSDMHSFKTEIQNTLEIYGVDSVFYMLKGTQWVNLIESPDALTTSQIRQIEVDYRKACTYDKQNLDLGKILVENSICSEIRCSLHHHTDRTDGGPSYWNLLCNHVLGQENTKLKMYQRIILDTKLSDFAGLNVTTYHQKIVPALEAAHRAHSLPITFGGTLLANHAGPTDAGFISLVTLYTGKMFTLNTTEEQYKETLDQLPKLEQVYRNSTDWETAHKNKGGAYVAAGLQQKASRDLSTVQCFGCNKMGHYRSDCPQKQGSGTEETTTKKKKKFIRWREVAPESGSATTMTKEANGVKTTYNWCTKCKSGKGLWTSTHTTDTHTGKAKSDATTESPSPVAKTLMVLREGGF